MVVTGRVNGHVPVHVQGGAVWIRNVEFRIAERQATGARVADIRTVLSVVNLGDAVLVVEDRVAAAAFGVGEDRIALRVCPGLRGGCSHDGDLGEPQHLHKGRDRVVADRDLDLLVVVAGRCDHRDGIAATYVRDAIERWIDVKRIALRMGRRLVENRQGVLHGVKQGVARYAGRVRVSAYQVLCPRKRAGIDRILHQAPLKIETSGIDRQRKHPANRNHGQRHDHDGLAVATSDADQQVSTPPASTSRPSSRIGRRSCSRSSRSSGRRGR